MKAILLSVTAIWLISPLPAQSNTPLGPLVPFGVIKGSVHDIETNQFVPWAAVEVVGVVPSLFLPDGTFEFYMIPPGVYTVKAMMTGYRGAVIDSIVVRMGQVTDVKARIQPTHAPVLPSEMVSATGVFERPATTPVGITTTLPAGTIKGFVRDARTKEPIVGANVGIDSRFGAMALEDGAFTITGVAPGVHTVGAGTIGYHGVTIEDIVVQAGRETTLPTIFLAIRPPTSGLRITRHDTRKWWIGAPETFPCTYEGLTKPYRPARHARELSANELDLLTHFYNEIVLEWIFPLSRDHEVTNPLPVLITTWSGLAEAPSDSFFAGISSDTLRTVRMTSWDGQPVYCMLKVNQQVSPDTLEVEASLNYESRGIGRCALATRKDSRWSFCLHEGIFTSIGCGPPRGSK